MSGHGSARLGAVRLDLDLVVLDGPRVVNLLAGRVVQDDVHCPPVGLAAVLVCHLPTTSGPFMQHSQTSMQSSWQLGISCAAHHHCGCTMYDRQ